MIGYVEFEIEFDVASGVGTAAERDTNPRRIDIEIIFEVDMKKNESV